MTGKVPTRWITWTAITSIVTGVALAWYGWMPVYERICEDGVRNYSDAGSRFAAFFETVLRMGVYALLLPLIAIGLQVVFAKFSGWRLVNAVIAIVIAAIILYGFEFVFLTGHDFDCPLA